MLDIDYRLLEYIKLSFPDREISEHIYYIRQCKRWIQISSPIKDPNVHYEYISGKVELHFEGEECEMKYREIIDFLILKTEDSETFVWDSWGYGYRCQYGHVIDSQDELKQILSCFIAKFDKLINEFNQYTIATDAIQLEFNDILSSQMPDVDLHLLNLKQVLELPLAIPDYQRIYCWEECNVKCLLEDIFGHLEKQDINSPYRLGTVILHHNEGKYDIIDGQQRLVTLSILLNILGVYPKLLDEKFSSKRSRDYVAYNKYLIHSFCQKHPCNFNVLAQKLLQSLEFCVLVLQNSSLDLAYTFFSNQNSRGVGLTDYDLLKAHHLRYIPQAFEKQSMRAAEVWNKMIEDGRVDNDTTEAPNYVHTLDTYIYRLRRWMRKKICEDGNNDYRVKREYEAAPIIDEISPFGEKFYFNEPIQGGAHFFTFVELHLTKYRTFSQTDEYKTIHQLLIGGSFQWYRDAIEGLLFGYYLKFGECYLTDAMVVIMRIALQHRYTNTRANKSSILQYVSDTDIILMIDRATSPTFFLAEARNVAKELSYPAMQNMSPIQRSMRLKAKAVLKNLNKKISIDSFRNINV